MRYARESHGWDECRNKDAGGTPASQGGILYTIDREHGAQESGNRPYASLNNHSPLEGESAGSARSRTGGGGRNGGSG